MRDQWFTWSVEFKVHERWVEDGFEMTDERAKEMVENALPHADGYETKAKVIVEPPQERIAKCQGYASVADKKSGRGISALPERSRNEHKKKQHEKANRRRNSSHGNNRIPGCIFRLHDRCAEKRHSHNQTGT